MTANPGGDALVMSGTVERGSFRLEADLRAAPGEVLGVLGPNGAGKTTLLRALSGLEALTSGSIRLGGLTMDDVATDTFVPAQRRPVGLVFQNYRLFPHLNVRDNVAYAPRVQGAGRRQARGAADTWLERLDLTALATRRPHQISGGQAQQVALARALAANPRFLLLDEPLSALDAKTRLDVRAQLRSHLEQFTGPVLIITHDPLEAMIMADRLLVIENGRVVQQGSPAQVASRPATQYVARLVGLNLYTGTLQVATRRVLLDAGGTFTVTLGEDDAVASARDGQSNRPVAPFGYQHSHRTTCPGQPPQRLAGNRGRPGVARRPGPRPGRRHPACPRRHLLRSRSRPRFATWHHSVAVSEGHRDRGISRPRQPSPAVTLPGARTAQTVPLTNPKCPQRVLRVPYVEPNGPVQPRTASRSCVRTSAATIRMCI